jgi:hypothetical protein
VGAGEGGDRSGAARDRGADCRALQASLPRTAPLARGAGWVRPEAQGNLGRFGAPGEPGPQLSEPEAGRVTTDPRRVTTDPRRVAASSATFLSFSWNNQTAAPKGARTPPAPIGTPPHFPSVLRASPLIQTNPQQPNPKEK